MAESDPIKPEDLFEDGAFDPAIAGAKAFLEIIKDVEKGIKSVATESTRFFGETVKSLSQLEQFNERYDELIKSEKLYEQLKGQRLKTEQELEKLETSKLRTEKAQLDLNSKQNRVLKDQSGILGQLLKQKRDLERTRLMAGSEDQLRKINAELFSVNTRIREVKEGGTKAFNSWGNALESFQFKFNTLGNLVGNFASSLASGALSGGMGLVTSALSAMAEAFIGMVIPAQKSAEVLKEETIRVKALHKSLVDLTDAERERHKLQQDLLVGDREDQAGAIEDLNKELDEQVATLEEQIRLEKELRHTKAGGLNDLNRELDVLKASGATKEKIAAKEKEIRAAELFDLEERKRILGDFAMFDIQLQQDILDKKNETAVITAKLNKEQKDERKKTADELWKEAQDEALRQTLVEDKRNEEKEKKEKELQKKLLEDQDEFIAETIKKWDKEAEADKKRKEEQLEREREFRDGLIDIFFEAQKKKLGNSAEDQKKLKQLNDLQIISEIGLAFAQSYEKYTKEDPKTALGKATRDTIASKVTLKLLASTMGLYEGADSVGEEHAAIVLNRSKDNLMVPLHGGERVVGYKDSMRIAGMTNEEVVKAAEMYRDGGLADVSRGDQVAGAMLAMLRNDMKKLTKTIEDKRELHVGEDEEGNLILGIKEKGVNRVTTHMKSTIVPTPTPFS